MHSRGGGFVEVGPAVSRYDRKDHLHQRAKREGYRSRAAFKLLELQQQHRLLRRGQRVIDLGCWPGGFMQVALEHIGPGGIVVGIDLAEMEPLKNENAIALVGSLEDSIQCDRILKSLNSASSSPTGSQTRSADSRGADLVLCDAAPKLTGVRDVDRAAEERLLLAVEALLPRLLCSGGDLLLKILEGPEAQQVDKRLRGSFARAKTVRLKATRKGSSERYLVARGYRPPEVDGPLRPE